MNLRVISKYIDKAYFFLFSGSSLSDFSKLAWWENIYPFSFRKGKIYFLFIKKISYYVIVFIFSIFIGSFIICFIAFILSDFFLIRKIPFLLFLSVYSLSYSISSKIFNLFKKSSKINFSFHFFYITFVLNIINLYLHYKIFYGNAGVYFFVVFFYLFLVVLSYHLSFHSVIVICLLSFGAYLFVCLNEFSSILLLTHTIVYKTIGWPYAWPSRFLYIGVPGPRIQRLFGMNVYYKHIGDSLLTWNHDILSYICVYAFLSLIGFFIFNFFYSWVYIKFRVLRPYYYFNFIIMIIAGFIMYWFVGFYTSFFIMDLLRDAWDTYLIISTYSPRTDYMTYIMIGTYVGLLVALYASSYSIIRLTLHILSDVSYTSDKNYAIKKRLLFGPKFSHMFWYFPSTWIKRIVVLAPEEEDVSEDEIYYYGGPNPTRVLFDRVTGEVTPIMDKDLVAEAYRKYYKFQKFVSRKPRLWFFLFYEGRWTREISFSRRRYLKILKNPGFFYFYPFKDMFLDYRLGRVINYDEMPVDEYNNPANSFFDSKMWEHVWYKSFGRYLPRGVQVYKPGRSFFNPNISAESIEDSIRPPMEGREPFLNAYSFRMNHMAKRSSLVEFSFNSSQIFNPKFSKPTLARIDQINGLKAYLVEEFGIMNSKNANPNFELFFLRVLDLVLNSKNWFFKNSGKVSRKTFEYNFNWLSNKLRFSTKSPWIYYEFPVRFSLIRAFSRLIFRTFKNAEFKGSGYSNVEFSSNKSFNSSRLALNRIVFSSSRNVELGFLDQLIEFGFSMKNPFSGFDGEEGVIEPKFIVGNFSKFSSYGDLVSQFANFPAFNYLSKWSLEFSGFFEKEFDLVGSNSIRGRFGRFRYVNSKILIENETSPKINDYFLNIFDWIKSMNSSRFLLYDIFLVLLRYYRFKSSFLGSSVYFRANTNRYLFIQSIMVDRLNFINYDSPNSGFYKMDILDTVDPDITFGGYNISKTELEVSYESFPPTDYNFKTSSSSSKMLNGNKRRFYNGFNRYGFDQTNRCVFSSTGFFYLNTYIFSTFFSEFVKGLCSSEYFSSKLNDLYSERFTTPFFYPFFDQKFSNMFLKFDSFSQMSFSNLGAGYILGYNSKVFGVFKDFISGYWKKFYTFKFVELKGNLFFRYFSYIFIRHYYGVLMRNSRKFVLTFENKNYFNKRLTRNLKTRHWKKSYYNWDSRFSWYPESISKNEFYASRSQVRSNVSVLDRINVAAGLDNEVVAPEFFEFGFIFARERVFQNVFK